MNEDVHFLLEKVNFHCFMLVYWRVPLFELMKSSLRNPYKDYSRFIKPTTVITMRILSGFGNAAQTFERGFNRHVSLGGAVW